ncbi:MAG: fibronectin type III domain-containing protein [bacterium]|nr:fibronectin type III domain-containing protein [bacterium]MDE0600246.1 fibronectin type III domain-containing protein [bacterium]
MSRTRFSQPSNPGLDVTWTAPAANGVTITGYEARYRKQDADDWTSYSGTLSATATTLKLAGLEAGQTYEAQVRAVSSGGAGPWSGTGSGQANRPPKRTALGILNPSYLLEWGGTDSVRTISGDFADDDSDTLTYTATSNYPGLIRPTIEGDDSDTLRIRVVNPGTARVTYYAQDSYGGRVSEVIDVSGFANLTRDIAERSAAGATAGSPVAGTAYQDETYTYALSGDATAAFVINSSTGQISLKEGATLDYETTSSYTGKVKWTVQGQEAVANLTINITDVEAGKPDTPTVTRTEFSEPTDPALDVTWTAPAANGLTITGYEARYRKKAAEGEEPADWTTHTGTLSATTLTLNLPSLQAGATYEAQVRAKTSEEGPGPWSDTATGRANRPPGINGLHVPESNLRWGQTYAWDISKFFPDPDGDTLTLIAFSNYPGIVSASAAGRDLLATGVNPSSATITYGARDPYGGRVFKTVTLTTVANPKRSIPERSPAGATVGRAIKGAAYGEETYTYALSGDATAAFVINSTTGQISVKEGATLDYETTSSYTGKVTWTVQEQTATANLTINTTDIEAGKPDTPTVARTEFSEPTDPALDITWTAPDANGLTITGYEARYRKKAASGENPASWTTYTGTLSATTLTFNLPNLQAGATYEAQVRAQTSEEGPGPWSDTGTGRANRPPQNTNKYYVQQNLGWGKPYSWEIETYFSDADGDTLTYTATSDYPGVINAWTVGSDMKMMPLNPSSATITYGVRDAYGGRASKAVKLTTVAYETREVAERSAAGATVGRPVVGNAYGDETYTHTLSGDAAAAFVIDSTTGQISVKEGATLDYETTSSYTGKVKWTVQGQEAVANLTINITDVEAGKPDTPTVTRTQFSEPTNPALDVTWTAPAANGLTITGYEARYRKEAAAGEEPASWTTYTGTLSATTLTLNLPNLEAGATYEAQVRAQTSEEGPGPWSDTGTGRANRPPGLTALYVPDQDLNWGTAYAWDISGVFSDADDDTLTYTASSNYPGIVKAWPDGPDLKAQGVNPSSATITYGARDPYGGHASKTVKLKTVANTTRSIPERSAAGAKVGRAVVGTAYQEETYTYALSGDAAAAFEINSTTGQISVKQGATLDYETTSSYTGKVQWTVQGQEAVANLTINITDVEAGKPDTPTVTRTQFSEPSDPALDVTWTTPDANGLTITGYEARYRKKAAAGEEAANWTTYTGTLSATTLTLNLPNLEPGATYEAQVRAQTSEEGPGPWSDTATGRANRPPQVTTDSMLLKADRAVGPDYRVSTYMHGMFTDPDGDGRRFVVTAQYPSIISAWIQTEPGGQRIVYRMLNPATSTLSYGAHDGYGGYVDHTVTRTGTQNPTRSIEENSAAGAKVGNPVNGRPHQDQALTYALSGDAAAAFEIDSSTGQISVKQGATLDYETTSSYTGEVTWTVQEQTATANLTINITDIEAGKPDTPTVTRTEFSEPSDPALDVTWTAPDANGLTITGYEARYRKKAADGENPADWTTHTGTLSAATLTVNLPNLDPGATYEAQIRAQTSEEGPGPWSDTATGRANRPPRRTAPTDATPTYRLQLGGDDALRTISGKFADDDSDTLTYTATSQYPGMIRVNIEGDASDTLRIRVLNPGASQVTYSAQDPYGGIVSETVNANGFTSLTRRVVENSPAGTRVGTPVNGRPYQDQALTYALSGDAAAAFVINSSTGQIRVKRGASPNYEAKRSYTGRVTWTVQGQTATANLTINITDVEPGEPDTPTLAQSTEDPTTVLDMAWTAPAANGSVITGYQVRHRKKAAAGEDPAEWTAYSGALTATDTALSLSSLEAGTTYQAQVRALSRHEGPGPWSSSGEGTTEAENRAPQFSRQALERSVPENSPAGTLIGEAVTAIDPEGHPLTYSLQTPSTLFAVDSATGQISVKEGANLDYETEASHTVIVEASDGLSLVGIDDDHIIDALTTVVIAVTDVAEPPLKPEAPAVTQSAVSPSSTLDVSWAAPDMTGKPDLTSYGLSYRPVGESQWQEIQPSGTQTSATIPGLQADTAYEVRVSAHNEDGASPWSDPGEGSTAELTTSAPPPPDTTPTPDPDPDPTPDPDPDPDTDGPNPNPDPDPNSLHATPPSVLTPLPTSPPSGLPPVAISDGDAPVEVVCFQAGLAAFYFPKSPDGSATPIHPDVILFGGSTPASGSDDCQEPTWTTYGEKNPDGYDDGYDDGNGGSANSPPVITKPDDKRYSQGQTISPFAIIVTDDGSPIVTVTGLPASLGYDPEEGMTSGAVASSAAPGSYVVTITADDGEYVVTETFTVTVIPHLSYAASSQLTRTASAVSPTAADSSVAERAPASDSLLSIFPIAPGLLGITGFEDLPLMPLSVIGLMVLLFLILPGTRKKKDRPKRSLLT